MKIENLLRENIRNLTPYTAARDEYKGSGTIFLDANESPSENGINRYPDPYQSELKKQIGILKGVETDQIFLGNGSDETLDLLIRAFCEPGEDNILIMPPTYGMYKVLADINNVDCIECPLNEDFSLNANRVLETVDSNTKIIFICSPNNPTGNSLDRNEIYKVLNAFSGIVVIDEAYIDFSKDESFINSLSDYVQLFVNQTFSKSCSAAGIRLGMGFANKEIVQALNRIKPPYNINSLTQKVAFEVLNTPTLFQKNIENILSQKEQLIIALNQLSFVLKTYPTDANFILMKVEDANAVYRFLIEKGIVVRNRSTQYNCENTLRISVGTSIENEVLLKALSQYQNSTLMTNSKTI